MLREVYWGGLGARLREVAGGARLAACTASARRLGLRHFTTRCSTTSPSQTAGAIVCLQFVQAEPFMFDLKTKEAICK